ncbi:MAG: glycogen debranching enzyme GlgX, partial [Acidobacteria bacterium]|nr:glycogen debranching enzyme GlgX [Acidobacteriota bacterium]
LGEGGYQVGNFPVRWTEWNGKYRDAVRRFWKGEGDVVSELATRLAGSSDLYEQSGRRPYASINFITSHDGFTLHDLVSYNQKHNEANGEDNRDGENNNLSWNCGAEGPTDDQAILALREKQKRNFLATLMLSQGVPMISGGDEIGRTQLGTNNAYCQDNEMSWLHWTLTLTHADLLEFTRALIRLRHAQPVLRRRKFFQGRSIRGAGVKDISWFKPNGKEMDDRDWDTPFVRSLGVLLNGSDLDETDEQGNPVRGDTLFLMFNADHRHIRFVFPSRKPEERWERLLDTADLKWGRHYLLKDHSYKLSGRSVAVFRLKPPDTTT